VIEGGAMRGVVTSGMVAGLEHLGLLASFDVIYGTSAGAYQRAPTLSPGRRATDAASTPTTLTSPN